jgi:hypothetical protein
MSPVSHAGRCVTRDEHVPTLPVMSGLELTKRRAVDLCRVAACLCCAR